MIQPIEQPQIELEVQSDHIAQLTKATPIAAVAELIWNALDADAQLVEVKLNRNGLDEIDEVIVIDDGSGISLDRAGSAFKDIGGSWKRGLKCSSDKGRNLHGKEGKGRLKAFTLGQIAKWETIYTGEDKQRKQYTITGRFEDIKHWGLTPETISSQKYTGTRVVITNTHKGVSSLTQTDKAVAYLARTFAPYMKQYKGVSIEYDGQKIDPVSTVASSNQYSLNAIKVGEDIFTATLQVIEWKPKITDADRKLCLCTEDGFSLRELDVGIRPGQEFVFTAYISSKLFEVMHENGQLELFDMTKDSPALSLVEDARTKLKSHFRDKKSKTAEDLIQTWKSEGIYPFSDSEKSPVDLVKKQVFDICAVNVNEYLPDFQKGDSRGRKFTLRMLKEALESNPGALEKIFNEVLSLPVKKQNELANLLERTSLSAIIEASKKISDRLTFLSSLELLVFDHESKGLLKERSQLHKIIEAETWIFGEEYGLSSSDEELTGVLKKHLPKLHPSEKAKKIKRDDGRKAILDLMLSSKIPSGYKGYREFLVVELKRPSQKVDLTVKAQIESYGIAVKNDEQFDKATTRWTFIAISNEITDEASESVNQPALPRGFFHDKDNCRIGLMSWSEVIQRARTRLELYKDQLNLRISHDDKIKYLNENFKNLLPQPLIAETEK